MAHKQDTEQKPETMTEEYFQLSEKYTTQYGQETIVLLQCGAFFEVYAYKCPTSGLLIGSPIQEFTRICQMNIADKKAQYKSQPLYMAGFRDYCLDKYLQTLVDHNYTVVVYIQKEDPKKPKKFIRVLDAIHSPGTHIGSEDTLLTNNIMCIWLEQSSRKKTFLYGVSVMNIFTGQTSLMEHETKDTKIQCTTFDELEKYISIYHPREILFVSEFDQTLIKEKVLPMIGVSETTSIHYYFLSDPIIHSCSQQTHQQYILSRYYGDEVLSICTEFHYHMIATQSFCFLIHFMEEHNKDLLRFLKWPAFENLSDQVQLANHTLRQLNIVELDASEKKTKFRSVLSFLNRCYTPMGKRAFQEIMTHPTFNVDFLEKAYQAMDHLLSSKWFEEKNFTLLFQSIRDIDKLMKQILTSKITTNGLISLYDSIQKTQQLFSSYDSAHKVLEPIHAMIQFMDSWITETGSIRRNVSRELDEEYQKQSELEQQLEIIRSFLAEKSQETIQFYQTEKKESIRLQMTKHKSENLKRNMISYEKSNTPIILEKNVSFLWKEVKFVSVTKTHVEISFPLCDQICEQLNQCRSTITEKNNELMKEYIRKMSEAKWIQNLETISRTIADLDVLVCKCMLAETYHYCRPTIGTSSSSVKATGLRHVLIEHIQTNEIYVTNDISLTSEGILLFGTNAVGKTSLMRSLGIAVIMAQCGMYVPCQSFEYVPYRAIYSRILGNDNLFKGLSTFAVEMSELRMILKEANEHSLILGDELCSGTELESALSIFVASLQWLSERKASFLFATHYHELTEKEEVCELENVRFYHLEVHYDSTKDCLIYDRKLKEGSGPRNYGLEVCKSLYLDESFLEKAYHLRRKYFPETEGSLSYPKSRYHSKKIKGVCEICGSEDIQNHEIHHLEEQWKAGEDGYLQNQYHKNHPANLISVCQKCHDSFHSHQNVSPLSLSSHDSKIRRKKSTNGKYILEKE